MAEVVGLPKANGSIGVEYVIGCLIEIAAQQREFDQTQTALVGSKNPNPNNAFIGVSG